MSDKQTDKLRKDGKVAVIFNSSHSNGPWLYGLPPNDPLMFHAPLARAIIAQDFSHVLGLVRKMRPEYHNSGFRFEPRGLVVYWIDEGEKFFVTEYDGLDIINEVSKMQLSEA